MSVKFESERTVNLLFLFLNFIMFFIRWVGELTHQLAELAHMARGSGKQTHID